MLLTMLAMGVLTLNGPGPLVLHGGGGGSGAARARALELAGGPKACVLVVPQAARDSEDAARELVELFREAGAREVRVLDLKDPAKAVTDVDGVDLVWITSGDQRRLMSALRGTGVAEAIRRRHHEGATVGGTSAGTAAASGLMITGGPETPDGPTPTAQGLDLWPGVVVDQHFIVRKREGRLRRVLLDHPGQIGVGIDEGTYVEVNGRGFTVGGAGGGATVIRDPSPEAKPSIVPVGASQDLDRAETVFP